MRRSLSLLNPLSSFSCSFYAHFSTVEGAAECLKKQVPTALNTTAYRSATIMMCGMHSMGGCDACTSASCPDALATLSALCLKMDMTPCSTWKAFCSAVGPSEAAPLCLPTTATPVAPSTTNSACITNSTAAECAGYTYPAVNVVADIANLCTAMSWMPGCSVWETCKAGKAPQAGLYCDDFNVLAALCLDMPGMAGCTSYRTLCKAGSLVPQCGRFPGVPRLPTTAAARGAVLSSCADHAMPSCGSCSATVCPDPLQSLADMCREMPGMSACAGYNSFCSATADTFGGYCGPLATDVFLPPMKMYFHQRLDELILWRTWRPASNGQYVGSIIAILLMGVVAQAARIAKGMFNANWLAHETDAGGCKCNAEEPEPLPRMWWLPSGAQLYQNAVRAALSAVTLTLDFFLMLVAMTFNVGLFTAVIVGYVIGTFLFSHVIEAYAAFLAKKKAAANASASKYAVASSASDEEAALKVKIMPPPCCEAESECCVHAS